jgi:hypothetical protein
MDEYESSGPNGFAETRRRENVILDMARAPGFTSARLREALKQSEEIH